MPNHCYQNVNIQGPRSLVRLIYDHLNTDTDNLTKQFCQLVLPMPFELHNAPKTVWSGYAVESWYKWRVENWGTKWDVADVEITDDLEEQGSRFDESATAEFEFSCWTAWSPPVPVWDKLHELGVRVTADYQDEGGMFEGRYENGVNESWDPEFEKQKENDCECGLTEDGTWSEELFDQNGCTCEKEDA